MKIDERQFTEILKAPTTIFLNSNVSITSYRNFDSDTKILLTVDCLKIKKSYFFDGSTLDDLNDWIMESLNSYRAELLLKIDEIYFIGYKAGER